ncbi:MAG: arginine repressor [Gammaproteobacteria bacterium]|nr:arginine repressor [Gammaproteobacteria bacterium]
MTSSKKDLTPILKSLLLKKSAKTQDEICLALKKQGYQVNQTKVSRLLKNLGAMKVKNDQGKIVYWLPKEPPPPNLSTLVSNLVVDVVANENMIIIHTSPGAASVIARVVDYLKMESEILGTIAGDDSIFIAPKSVANIKAIYKKIRSQLGFN